MRRLVGGESHDLSHAFVMNAILFKKGCDVPAQVQQFRLCPVTPPQLEYFSHQPVKSLCVIADDAGQAHPRCVALFIDEQFSSVADC